MSRWLPFIQVQIQIPTSVYHTVKLQQLPEDMSWYSIALSAVEPVSQQACQHCALKLASMDSNVTCALQLELLLR